MINDITFFKNAVSSDIYIGRRAGKQLLHDIDNAQRSIKIISPFLSPIYVERLIHLKNKGIDVHLITSDEIEDYKTPDKKSIIPQLIRQVRHTDENQKKRRDILIRIKIWFLLASILIFLISISSPYLLKNFNFLEGIILSVVLFITYISIKSTVRKKRIYTYTYKELFPFRVFISPYKRQLKGLSDYYIHSKVYIIDDMIAYLGSINFSKGGLDYNFETRIRITDKDTIVGLNTMFDELFSNKDNYFILTETWGKQIYSEPIN
jgi:phosphatidylserine/phosphatidylglycerophosphate/cardiolipin synthase-like enzyme